MDTTHKLGCNRRPRGIASSAAACLARRASSGRIGGLSHFRVAHRPSARRPGRAYRPAEPSGRCSAILSRQTWILTQPLAQARRHRPRLIRPDSEKGSWPRPRIHHQDRRWLVRLRDAADERSDKIKGVTKGLQGGWRYKGERRYELSASPRATCAADAASLCRDKCSSYLM